MKNQKEPMTLDKLAIGGSCVIEQVGNQRGAVKRRLIDMGLTPGTTVELIKTAPFGDPMEVRLRGYGVVTPERSEIMLDEPQVIKHGNKYGVKMKAEAPSINMIKAHIETEIAPIVGSQQQAEDLITYIKQNARESEDGIWNTNIFGKSIQQIVEDGIQAKVSQVTEDCQMKLQDTLQKIINDSNGGMICIII